MAEREHTKTLTPEERRLLSASDLDGDFVTCFGLEDTPLMYRSGYMRQFGGHTTHRFTDAGKQWVRDALAAGA